MVVLVIVPLPSHIWYLTSLADC